MNNFQHHSPFIKFARKRIPRFKAGRVEVYPIAIYDTAPLVGLDGACFLIKLPTIRKSALIEIGMQEWRSGSALRPIEPVMSIEIRKDQGYNWLLDIAVSVRFPLFGEHDAVVFRLRSLQSDSSDALAHALTQRLPGDQSLRPLVFFANSSVTIRSGVQIPMGCLTDSSSSILTEKDLLSQLRLSHFARIFFFHFMPDGTVAKKI